MPPRNSGQEPSGDETVRFPAKVTSRHGVPWRPRPPTVWAGLLAQRCRLLGFSLGPEAHEYPRHVRVAMLAVR